MDKQIKEKIITSRETGTGGFHCLSFQEAARLYETSWNRSEVRRLFANVPTFMLPDDHDFANGFDITGGWHEQMNNDRDWRAWLRDATMAYWFYQGWGNVSKKAAAAHPILKIIESAYVGDVLGEPGELGKAVEKQLDRTLHAPVYYTIPTSPPIIALDTRADREFVAPIEDTLDTQTTVTAYRHPDDMIMSDKQFQWLEKELAKSDTPIIASAVPLLQNLIGDRIMVNLTRRLPSEFSPPPKDQDMVDALESFVRKEDSETWYAWPKSVERLLGLISTRHAVLILAGDVHHSYLFDTLRNGFDTMSFGITSTTRVIQAVSSPLRYPLHQNRIDGVEALGGPYPREKDSHGRWEEGWFQPGNKEHDLRDTFELPQTGVFPDGADVRTFHDGRYTVENLIATLALKKRKLVLQWWASDGAKLIEIGRYAPTMAL
jgi:hypothetical protein